jgi:hypothetical protein
MRHPRLLVLIIVCCFNVISSHSPSTNEASRPRCCIQSPSSSQPNSSKRPTSPLTKLSRGGAFAENTSQTGFLEDERNEESSEDDDDDDDNQPRPKRSEMEDDSDDEALDEPQTSSKSSRWHPSTFNDNSNFGDDAEEVGFVSESEEERGGGFYREEDEEVDSRERNANDDEGRSVNTIEKATSSQPPTTTASSSKAGLQFMITQRMRKVLTQDLGYTNQEVQRMKPDVAAVVIQRNLIRPKSGMPAPWFRDAPNSTSSRGRRLNRRRAFRLLVKPARMLYSGAKIAAPVIITGILSRKVVNSFSARREEARLSSSSSTNSMIGLLPPQSRSSLLSSSSSSHLGVPSLRMPSLSSLNNFLGSSSPFARRIRGEDDILEPLRPVFDSSSSSRPASHFMYGELDDTWLDKVIAGLLRSVGTLFGGGGSSMWG